MLVRRSEVPISTRVGSGSVAPRSSKILAKIGTMKMSMNEAAKIAKNKDYDGVGHCTLDFASKCLVLLELVGDAQ